MNWKKTAFSAILSAAIVLSSIPAAVFAENGQMADAPEPVVIAQEDGSVSVGSFDSDELLMQYIDQQVAEEIGSGTDHDAPKRLSPAVGHKRRDVLSDVAGNMYDALAPSVRAVAAGEQSQTAFVVPASAIFGRAVYDAEDLGVDSLFEKDGETITMAAFDAFKRKLCSDLTEPLSDMLSAMISDMPYELYWLDNEAGINFVFNDVWFENNMKIYTDGAGNKSIGIETADTAGGALYMTFNFFVSQDYSLGGSPTQYGPKRTTVVDTRFTTAAANTVQNVSGIIESAKNKPDDEKLYQYKDDICRLTSYHPTAMADPNFPYGDPWQLIYVFDGDPATKVVCEGYSKAFQYLCDKTAFNSSSVESRLVSGRMTGNTKGAVVSGAHMWNIVHMDDGNNYIADITNCDDESMADDPMGYPDDVFLRGAASGSVSNGYTFKYDEGTLYYQYDDSIRKIFSEEELTLSFTSYPYGRGGAEADSQGSGSSADDAAYDDIWYAYPSENAAAAADALEWNGTRGSIKAVRSLSVKGSKKAVNIKWKKATKKSLKKFDKVEIQVCPDKGFARANTVRKEVSKKKVSATVKGLSKKSKYYVRVRNVRGSGTTKIVSKWSKVTKVTTK